jgi:hypothetical protein
MVPLDVGLVQGCVQNDIPSLVAAYTVLEDAYTLLTVLLPNPFVVLLFVNVDPPSADMLNPPFVAA